MNQEPINFKDILKNKQSTKPPAYPWQDLALQIINELAVPNFKRNSVFKVCKQFPRPMVEKAMNDTKELIKDGQAWKYFFKIISTYENKKPPLSKANQKSNNKI